MRLPVRLSFALASLAIVAGCRSSALTNPDDIGHVEQSLGCADRRLLSVGAGRIARLDSTGGATTLFSFGTGLVDDPQNIVTQSWAQRGSFVAAVAYLYQTAQHDNRHEYVLLDGANVVLHDYLPEGAYPQLYLGDGGSLAVAAQTNWVRLPNGTIVPLGEYVPFAGMLSENLVPVIQRPGPSQPGTPGLLRLGSPARFEPLPGSPSEWTVTITPHLLVYVSSDGGRPTLHAVGAQGDTAIELPASEGWQVTSVAGDRYVLLAESRYPQRPLTRIDLQTRTRTALAPASASSIYDGWNATIDEQGTVFLSTVVDDRLQLQRTSEGGKSFSPVGLPMTVGPDLGFQPWLRPVAHHGNALILNLSTGYGDFLNSVQFSADETHSVLDGGGYYLGYPSYTQFDLTSDGQCGAVWVQVAEPSTPEERFSLVLLEKQGPRTIASSADLTALQFSN